MITRYNSIIQVLKSFLELDFVFHSKSKSSAGMCLTFIWLLKTGFLTTPQITHKQMLDNVTSFVNNKNTYDDVTDIHIFKLSSPVYKENSGASGFCYWASEFCLICLMGKWYFF